jgi:hypothetical protein
MNKPFALLIALLLSLPLMALRPDDWLLQREKKGIKVFTKKSKWSRLHDSKACMALSESPEELLRLITDVENYPNWVARCDKGTIIAWLSPNEFIAQIEFNAPWPVANRDCILRMRIIKDKESGAATVTQTSEPHYVRKREGVVRIEQMQSEWRIIPQPNGKVLVENEYSSNPGGNIPDWLTNTQSVETPLETFGNLRSIVAEKRK